MGSFIELIVNYPDDAEKELSEILIAFLDDLGFQGFLEEENSVIAYMDENEFHDSLLTDVKNLHQDISDVIYRTVPEKNWNAAWEKSFSPIVINDQVIVKAPFHKASSNYKYSIVIEPKMSFGTGHHETTELMIREMLKMDFSGSLVLDLGCGTGILAILASLMNAAGVVAVDNDLWAYTNTRENIELNHVSNIKSYQGDISLVKNIKFNIILANIDRNTHLDQLHDYSKCLINKGYLILSGFYSKDTEMLITEALKHGLTFQHMQQKNEWVAGKFHKID